MFFLMLTLLVVDDIGVGRGVRLPWRVVVMLVVPLVLLVIVYDLVNDWQFISLVRYTIKDIMGGR